MWMFMLIFAALNVIDLITGTTDEKLINLLYAGLLTFSIWLLEEDEDNVLQTPCECEKNSNVWATLKIPIDAMSKENIKKVFDAIKLLSEAGVYCDSGCGGSIDLELDWSLEGAYLLKRELRCMNCRKENNKLKMITFSKDDKLMKWPFCNEECFWNRANSYIKQFSDPKFDGYGETPPVYKLIRVVDLK